ncbi:MAG: hypothetical protein PVH45_05065 [Candidatus Omnitrophota bacterium]|jgi:hypothetical protein
MRKRIIQAVKKKIRDEIKVIDKFYKQYKADNDPSVSYNRSRVS